MTCIDIHKMSGVVIGIDLGTTNSCAAYYIDGQVKILENIEGERITPSFIFYSYNEGWQSIVGKYAKHIANQKPEWGIYEIKRLIGRKFDDPLVQQNLKNLLFEVDHHEGNLVVRFKHDHSILEKSPQELCATILAKIKKDVETKLGHSVNKAVVTVPAYFNVNQRKVTLAAANEAGFTVLKLLNEPTAAALSYYFQTHREIDDYSLVYDLGGGTFDVSILKKKGNKIDVICVGGNSHLGGQDLDNLIYDYVCEELISKYDYDPNSHRLRTRRLRNECEDAKKRLSHIEETVILCEGYVRDHDCIEISLTRQRFEALADELFKKTIDIVDSCLKSCNLPKTAIEEIILSGGSSRIPKIQEMLSVFFDGKDLNRFVNPDECVAEGAAIQAAILSNNPYQQIDKIQIMDVTSLSLGLADAVNLMHFVIKRNTPLPADETVAYYTVYDQQKSLQLRVFEGERLDARKNHYLGTITISDITPAPPGQCEIICTMKVDKNGILSVRAEEENRNNVKDLKIAYARGLSSDGEIHEVLIDAQDNKEEDERFKKLASSKNYLLEYCRTVVYNLNKRNLIEVNEEAYELCKEMEVLAENLEIENQDQLDEMIEEIKGKCEVIVKKYKFEWMPLYEL